MKKYFIADLLSLMEIIMGCTLIAMTFSRASCDFVIWVFVIGELCDAFDGIAARRWPYPPMDKPYWWRAPRTVQIIEHTSDILILATLAIYLLTLGNPVVYQVTLSCGIAIAGFCAGVEVTLHTIPSHIPKSERQRIIVIRRILYLLGIAIGLVELIACTTWPVWLKAAVYALGVIISLALVVVKWDRLTNSSQSLREFLRQRSARHEDL